jgi:hypothetical protein
LGACFHGGRHLAWSLVYLLRSFITVEGALVEEGASVVGRSYTHQIAVGSVAEGGHTTELHSCGGVFHSELTVCIWSSFSGFESIYGGHAPGSFGLVFQLGSSCYCIRFIYILYLLYSTIYFLIYRHISQTGFPRGGFIQGHVDQKYLCTK